MLVLSRKTDQLIRIGPNVTVRVLKVKGQQVRLGIEAPREVRVTRFELNPESRLGMAQENLHARRSQQAG